MRTQFPTNNNGSAGVIRQFVHTVPFPSHPVLLPVAGNTNINGSVTHLCLIILARFVSMVKAKTFMRWKPALYFSYKYYARLITWAYWFIIDRISERGNAIATVRLSVCPSVRLFPLYLRKWSTVDFQLSLVSRSWPYLAGNWRSRS